MKFNKSGQAALEFLTTYGWAFLIIIVVFLGLNYFDVFNFSKRLPEGCALSGKLECGESFLLNSNGSMAIQVKNNNLKTINVGKIAVIEKSLLSNDGLKDSDWCINDTVDVDVNPGKYMDVLAVVNNTNGCGLEAAADLKKSFELKVYYTTTGTTIESATTGQLTATVQ